MTAVTLTHSLGPDEHPIAQFNRNQTGLNPDLDVFPPLLPDATAHEREALKYVQPADKGMSDQRLCNRDDLELIWSPIQRFACLKINWGNQNHREPLVVLLQFSVHTNQPETTQYMIEQIRRQANGRPILVVNSPGMLGSSPLTRAQRQAIKQGDFDPLAASLLEAIKVAMNGKCFAIAGFSMGARIALAVAKVSHLSYRTRDVTRVVAIEPPGFESFTRKEFRLRFAETEGSWLEYYQQSTTDHSLQQCFGPKMSQLRQAASFIMALRGDFLGNIALMDGLRVDTCRNDLEALQKHAVPVTLIQGSNSAISTRPKHLTPNEGSNLRLIILPGDTHAYGEEGRRIAWHITSVLAR